MEQPNVQTPEYSPLELQYRDRASSAMVLGIISVALFLWPLLSIGSIVLGAIALKQSNANRALARENGFSENSMNTAGYITGMIGVIGGSLITLFYLLILVLAVIGVALFSSELLSNVVSSMPIH